MWGNTHNQRQLSTVEKIQPLVFDDSDHQWAEDYRLGVIVVFSTFFEPGHEQVLVRSDPVIHRYVCGRKRPYDRSEVPPGLWDEQDVSAVACCEFWIGGIYPKVEVCNLLKRGIAWTPAYCAVYTGEIGVLDTSQLPLEDGGQDDGSEVGGCSPVRCEL